MRNIWPAVTGGLLTCTLAGVLLAGGRESPRRSVSGNGSSSTLSAGALDLLTQSGSYAENEYLLSRAERELTRRCMGRQGHRYPVDQAGFLRQSDEDRGLNMNERRRHGYGLFAEYSTGPAHGNGREAADNATAPPPAERAAYLHALRGSAGDVTAMQLPGGGEIVFSRVGCEAESRQRLYRSLTRWAQVRYVPQRLNLSVTHRVKGDPALAAAMRRWAECMAVHGYRYSSPGDASDRLRVEYREVGPTAALRRREIDIALADGRCASHLHIPSTVLTLKKRYANLLPAKDKLELEQLTRSWLATAATARSLASTGSPRLCCGRRTSPSAGT